MEFLLPEPGLCSVLILLIMNVLRRHHRENRPDLNKAHKTKWKDDWRIIEPPAEDTDSRYSWMWFSVTVERRTQTAEPAGSHIIVWLIPPTSLWLNKEVRRSLFLNLLWATTGLYLSLSILVILPCFKVSGFCGGWNYTFDSCDVPVFFS